MRKLPLIAILFVASFACHGAQPTVDSIETLLKMTKVESLLDTMYGQMEQMMRQGMTQAVAGKNLSAEQQRVLETAPRQFAAVMKSELSWASLKPIYLDIYRATFTQDEVNGMIAFYRTPAGAATINKMPVVLQKANAAMQGRLPSLVQKMQAAMDKALAEAGVAKPAGK